MKVQLMDPGDDTELGDDDPPFAEDVAADLHLHYLWDAMSGGDPFLRAVARAALLRPLADPGTIRYRQEALADCLRHPATIAELYDIAVDAVTIRRSLFLLPVHGHPDLELSTAVRMLTELADRLDRLRRVRAPVTGGFASPAFRRFFAMIEQELDDAFMARLRRTLRELSFPQGLLTSAGIGPGGEVVSQILRRPREENRRLFDRTPMRRPVFSFTLPDRDEAGANALARLRDRSVNDVANAATQSVDHVLAFFTALRTELAFYLACGNAVNALHTLGAPTCTPDPWAADATVAIGLYDPCLALRTGRAPVGNSVDLHSDLLVITGANRGGKSTLLRSLGTAQLMMQAGMPAPARDLAMRPVGQVYTHWAREEDAELRRGKLDEELGRMGRIIAVIRPGDLLLCNESFSATNEAEGSQLLLDVTRALVDAGVRVHSVTHLYEFARAVERIPTLRPDFLRAPRTDAADHRFRLVPGPALITSFGLDVYDQVFGGHDATAAVHRPTSGHGSAGCRCNSGDPDPEPGARA
ncbi:hypothetical protein BKD30_01505 [Tersicoccus phoenicis]|uniref:DNA mismatch repair proteins mutS family domain-containing protein n=1 Tax=Tersicoccus phoenicis TaxID=554083 RepID=A0A1R1LNB4_9MICC|nr:hypothetical protein [Tersicoccus phoenicis]OMH29023.1 hypothetical protein BKD30_01505 [Tersicoccus phoenicis]